MQPKVFGTADNPSRGTGALTMDFASAKKAAQARREETFEINKKRFFGEDGWDKSQYKNSTKQFYGC